MANETTVTTAAQAIPAIKSAAIERTASAMRVFRPLITEVPFTGPGSTLDLITLDSVAAASYTEANTRTFTTGDPTKVTWTPAEIDVAMSFTDKAMRRTVFDLVTAYTPEIARAVAVKQDADVAAEDGNFSGTAVDEGDAGASVAKLVEAIGNVRSAAKDQVGDISAVMHTAKWHDIVTDSNVLSTQIRGQSGTLYSGMIELVGGSRVYFTTAIESDGGSPAKYNNMVFTRRAIALVYKTAFTFESWREPSNKTFNIAGGADYDVAMRFAGEGSLYTVQIA